MSGISSGIGLISGLPTASIIEQLLAIEARPLNFVQQRIAAVQSERTAFADLAARILSLKNSILLFDEPAFFQNFAAASSNSNVLTATVGQNATVGNFSFLVHSLVRTHQLIGAGRSDADTTPVGAGTLTLEVGNGRVHRDTLLNSLRGGAGVGRGIIRVTDRSGASTDLDLRYALTVDEVLDAFNNQSAVDVKARVSGDQIIIEDQTADGQATGTLSIVDLAGGSIAADLGIAGSAIGGATQLTSADLVQLVDGTLLSALNDGNGVRRAVAGGDFDITVGQRTFRIALDGFLSDTTRLEVLNSGQGVRLGTIRITDRSGASADIDLSEAQDIGDVIAAINAAEIGVDATYTNSRLQLNDTTGGTQNLKIEDVDSFAAADLGIKADVAESALLGNNIYRIASIGDVVRAINFAVDANGELNDVVQASIAPNGNGLTLESSSPFDAITIAAVTAADGTVSRAAEDLGLPETIEAGLAFTTRDLVAGLNTVLLRSLNGGSGVDLGAVSFTARDGTTTQIDFSGAQTVQDIIDLINETTATSKISAGFNPVGNGLQIIDESDGTSGPLVVADVGDGTTAADLGIAGTAAGGTLRGSNAQLQYISEATRLADLNNGQGVPAGQFRITSASGVSFTVNIGANQKTVGDVIRLVNVAAPPGLSARINDNGDGIVVEDTTTGAGPLKIENVSGQAASALNLAGQAQSGQNFIDGSFEYQIELDADDTLSDLVAKLNASNANLTAGVINDGSSLNPFRLSVTSGVSGRNGYVLIDPGASGIDLGLQTLVEGQDAVLALGDAQSPNPVLISSASNTLSNVIPGVTLNLTGTSPDPVDITISEDVDVVVSALQTFVTNYNAALSRIDELTAFNQETGERGILLGDATVSLVRDRLYRAVSGPFAGGASTLSRLSSIGIRSGPGGQLTFDEEQFREVYEADPAAVHQLFTAEETGVGDALDAALEGLTGADGGLLTRQDDLLGEQVDLLNNRAEALQDLLDRKRVQLERRFQGLESALASLQAQQSALAALNSLAAQSAQI